MKDFKSELSWPRQAALGFDGWGALAARRRRAGGAAPRQVPARARHPAAAAARAAERQAIPAGGGARYACARRVQRGLEAQQAARRAQLAARRARCGAAPSESSGKRSPRPVPACQNSRASSSRRSTRPAHAPRSRPTRRSRRGRVRRVGASARPARARSACTRGSVLERTPPHPRARAEALDAARTGGGGHAGGHRAGEAARDGWAGRGERGATKTSSRSSGVPHFVRSRAPYLDRRDDALTSLLSCTPTQPRLRNPGCRTRASASSRRR